VGGGGKMEFNNLVKKYRNKKGMGLREFAKYLEISPSYLCKIESGERGLSIPLKLKLQKKTNIPKKVLDKLVEKRYL
jgi:transcriptional regulator with XRE-family HTH domain